MTPDHDKFMRLAIEKAKEGISHGQSPFGACIVRDGSVVACAHNVVWKTMDITAHAEIHALRLACEKLGTIDLSGCTIYSTTEPCPMCFSACHWARIERVFFGARIQDARDFGFNELDISNEQMKERGGSPMLIVPETLREENVELFRVWSAREDHRSY